MGEKWSLHAGKQSTFRGFIFRRFWSQCHNTNTLADLLIAGNKSIFGHNTNSRSSLPKFFSSKNRQKNERNFDDRIFSQKKLVETLVQLWINLFQIAQHNAKKDKVFKLSWISFVQIKGER